MGAEVLPWVLTSGWASGVNSYAVVLMMGILGRFGVDAVPATLERTDVMATTGGVSALASHVVKVGRPSTPQRSRSATSF